MDGSNAWEDENPDNVAGEFVVKDPLHYAVDTQGQQFLVWRFPKAGGQISDHAHDFEHGSIIVQGSVSITGDYFGQNSTPLTADETLGDTPVKYLATVNNHQYLIEKLAKGQALAWDEKHPSFSMVILHGQCNATGDAEGRNNGLLVAPDTLFLNQGITRSITNIGDVLVLMRVYPIDADISSETSDADIRKLTVVLFKADTPHSLLALTDKAMCVHVYPNGTSISDGS